MNAREWIKAYVDGEATIAERHAVEALLKSDPTAAEEADALRSLSEQIRTSAVEPAVTGKERTLDRLAKLGPARVPKRAFPWRLALGGAAAIVLVALFFPVLNEGKEAAKRSWGESAVMSEAPPSAGMGYGGAAGAESAATADMAAPQNSSKRAVSGGDLPATPGVTQPLMIRTGQITLAVESVRESNRRVVAIAEGLGGMLQNSSISANQGSVPKADMVIRVPEKRFTMAMEQLSELGEVKMESSTGEDVTTQVADVEARLKVLRAEEDSFLTLLRGARRVNEIIEIKDRLSTIRQEIESMDAQRKALRTMAAYSTIHVSLEERVKADQPAGSPNWEEDAWESAKNALGAVGRALGRIGIYLAVFSPLWLPVLLVVIWLRRRR